MEVLVDFHMHSSFSGDSEAPMEAMILEAIRMGMREICFTEHMDLDFPAYNPGEEGLFEVDLDAYLKGILEMRKKYGDQIWIGHGLELGLQPQLAAQHARLVRQQDFDFVIGSSHICHGRDPYYPEFYEGRSEEEAYREYFESEIENLRCFSDFDVYGHLDYVVRYGPNRDREYTYEKYRDLLDQVLELLLEKGKGLEINTGGIRYGLKDLHPLSKLLMRYKKLGGEIITVGSDAHKPEGIGRGFVRAAGVLQACGFSHYTVFKNRQPEFRRLK